MPAPTEEEKARVQLIPGIATAASLALLQLDVDGLTTDVTTLLARLTAARAVGLDTTLAEAVEIERHLHNRELWFGISADQSGNNWGLEDGLNPYRAISGNGEFGKNGDDEAKLLGTDDTPVNTGMTWFDAHRLEVESASNANPFVVRMVWGSGTLEAAVAARQHTTTMVMEARKGSPVPLIVKRAVCGTDKVWIQVKNGTNNAWLDFFFGMHEYEE